MPVVIVVAVALVLPTIGAKRLRFWFSWAPVTAFAVCLFDVALCSAAGAAGALLASRGGWHPTSSQPYNAAVPALVANVSLRMRRGSRPRRGDSLALSLVTFCHDWVEQRVDDVIDDWTKTLTDDELLYYSVDLDASTARRGSVRQRQDWRADCEKELSSADPSAVREARTALRKALKQAVIVAERRRPR